MRLGVSWTKFQTLRCLSAIKAKKKQIESSFYDFYDTLLKLKADRLPQPFLEIKALFLHDFIQQILISLGNQMKLHLFCTIIMNEKNRLEFCFVRLQFEQNCLFKNSRLALWYYKSKLIERLKRIDTWKKIWFISRLRSKSHSTNGKKRKSVDRISIFEIFYIFTSFFTITIDLIHQVH